MYAQHWGLVDIPFQSTIDRRWFYEGPTHEEALARLLFLVEQHRRCGVLSGEGGTGKSMLLSVLKRAVLHAQGEVCELDVSGRCAEELVWELAAQLRLSPRKDERPAILWRKIEETLIGNQIARAQTLITFDHFEWADRDCQRVVARLLHLSAHTPSWTTIVTAVRDDAVEECCGMFLHLVDLTVPLTPFQRDETRDYVIRLLNRAGRREPLFTDSALDRIHEYSGGVPREINRLCDMGLLAAMSAGAAAVTAEIVSSVAGDEVPANRFDDTSIMAPR